MTLTFYSFGIDPVSMRPVRQRVVDLAFTQAESSDIPSAVRAIKTLEQAIRGPIGMYNRELADNEHDSWAPEFCRSSSASASSAPTQTATRPSGWPSAQALGWHADHSKTATKQAAQAALASLATTIEDDLAACLHAGWDRIAMRSGLSFEEAERAQREEFSRVAAAISEGRSDQEVLDRLEHRLRIERLASERVDGSGRFIAGFLTGRPSAATLLCQRVLAGELPELAVFTAIAIGVLANGGDAGAIAFASSMLANGRHQVAVGRGLRAVVESRRTGWSPSR